MSCEVIVAPSALQPLETEPERTWLTDEALESLEKGLGELAADPVGLSRKACLPYIPIGHLYQFRHYVNERKWLVFTVFFVFGPKDGQISVSKITVSKVP